MGEVVTGILKDRRVLITGASRGVGFEIAKRFLSEGAEVVGIGRNPPNLLKAADRLRLQPPGQFHPLEVDLLAAGCEHRIVEDISARWGALDILVNNAAIMHRAPGAGGLDEESVDVFERTITVNLVSPYRVTRALLPLLEKGHSPRVVHLTSGAGTLAGLGEPGLGSYRLSKWALNGLTKIMAAHWKGRVSVNALDPGWVRTDMGGSDAPGSPVESAQAALNLVQRPWGETGKLFKNGEEIDF